MPKSAILLAFSAVLANAATPTPADLLARYQQLRTIALEPNRTATVENLELKKDAATFVLKNGSLYFLAPAGDAVTGAVFLGDGVFTLKPSAEIEQKQLARFTDGKTQLEEPFRELVLIFTDSTLDALSGQVKIRAGAVPAQATDQLEDLRKKFREELYLNLEARILAALCHPKQGGFLASIKGQRHGQFFFEIDPQGDEQVQLVRFKHEVYFDLWSSFRLAGAGPGSGIADVIATKIDATIDKGARLAAEAEVEFTAREDGPRVVRVSLARPLRVTKVADSGGTEMKFIQEDKKKDGELWVIAPEPLVKGRKYAWKFSYAGEDVIEKAGPGNFFVGARTSWYPSIASPSEWLGDRATFQMTFRVPKEFTLVASGRLVNRKQDGKHEISEWQTDVPCKVAGFNYGRYKSKSFKADKLEVSVYANPEIPDELRNLQVLLDSNPAATRELGITTGGFTTTGMMASAGAEALNSMRLYSHYFGEIPFQSISVTQQPAGNFGQSWPTLVFMPYTAFLDSTIKNQLQMNRGASKHFFDEVGSHEVAHQWWGHIVSPKTYHDVWLSEGFAQFSAGLYLHRLQKDRAEGDKKLRAFLENEREFILTRMENGQRPNDAGPIWIGHRLSSEKTPRASRLVYCKGGYVLHMLRMMLYDMSRDNDTRFIQMMRDFVQTHHNREVSSEDFKAIVDKHFGQDMGWFFKQWVYGTEIPKVSVRYALADASQGAELSGEVSMKGVSPDFRLVLPFLLRSNHGALSGKLNAQGESSAFKIPLPVRPESVEFNPLHAMLCELEVRK